MVVTEPRSVDEESVVNVEADVLGEEAVVRGVVSSKLNQPQVYVTVRYLYCFRTWK